MMSIPSPPHAGDNPTDMSSPHIDTHQDLFPDYCGGTASSPSAPKDEFQGNDSDNGSNKDEFLGNDINNGSNKDEFPVTDIQNGNNDCPSVIEENNLPAPAPVPLDSIPEPVPVPPGSSGEGLPYAPIHWPNAGDIWSWKVGKRVNTSGFFNDRFLSVPESLRKTNVPKFFTSKPMLERFILSTFPDADIDSFFASFVWKVPAILEPSTKALTPSAPAEAAPAEEDDKKEIDKITPRRTNRKRAPPPSPFIAPTPTPSDSQKMLKKPKGSDKSKRSTKPERSAKPQGSVKPKRQTRQSLKDSARPQVEIQDTNDGLDDVSFLDDEAGRAEFDNYLNSLDEILVQPWFQEPFYQPATMHNFFAAEVEMAEAQRKLSSFLNMDFPSLICFKDVDELASLASKLQKDPTLTAEQLVKLKLIEEIPTFGIVFLENREVMEQADQFFRTLKENKAKVASLKQEYCEINQVVTNLESEVNSTTMAVQNIDDQIAQLDARRAEVMKLIDKKKRDKDELIHNQKLVANSIPKVVHEVQLANARKPEWELKKESGVRREAEILARFAPLKGFSL
ncbi:uncharacterized protein LOC120198702 isoform X1 [Hibiscus syriacus]|uniref:uncharacterized protein LOC120198702 isoform X1 n=1 Tax=Hibiscus syriacus TaxID=106335 RepID=UPI001921AB1B|nr:uncharacterized protein LOC120198702 isoform X1 [Hibiscus syriacus]